MVNAMQNLDLILTLTLGLSAALVFGYVTQRLGLSPIVGYLFAGVVIGPHTPGWEADRHLAEQLAEVGVILLMFGVGLQFHIKELLAVRRVAVPGAIVQSVTATLLGAVVVHAMGWGWAAGLVLGAAISVASTVVLTRVLTDFRDLHTPTGHIAIGWLVVEDLFTVLLLVMLPALFGPAQEAGPSVFVAVALALVKVTALGAFVLIGGGRLVPWLLDHVAATRSRELFTLTVLVLALGVAVSSAMFFGVSVALGAFLAGMAVGRSEFSLRAASEALPMRDAFAVLFFVSVGMLLDPASLLDSPRLVLSVLAVVMIGKPLAALLIVWLLRYPPKVALAVAVALAQIGEFSFMLATLGTTLGILPAAAMNVLVAAAIFSITLNPIFYRAVDPMERWLSRHPRLWALLTMRVKRAVPSRSALDQVKARGEEHARETGLDAAPAYLHLAVVIGYGPVGQTLARLLRENEIESTIVELNMETVRRLNAEGIAAVYGDASRAETLKGAGIEQARSLILSASDMNNSEEVIRVARDLNPKVRILARAVYARQLPALRRAGADAVFSAEGEVALAMTEAILRGLGATPEQVDRERERVHADLFGPKVAEAQG
jgi:CPA2 family monovalent cation:H+ antiporter-2